MDFDKATSAEGIRAVGIVSWALIHTISSEDLDQSLRREQVMQRFRNILVPMTGDLSRRPVLTQATRLAKQNRAAIKLVAVVEDLPWYSRLVLPAAEELQGAMLRIRSEGLEALAEPLRQDGAQVSTEVLRGRPYLEISREVLKGAHDLIMKEAEPNMSVLFGSTDMHLLRTCPCPVWLLKPGHGDQPSSRILAAVDPAPPPDEADLLHLKEEIAPKDRALDVKILELASSHAERQGAELHVLHAWSAPGEELVRGEMLLTQDQVDRYVEDTHAEARKALDRLLAGIPAKPGRFHVHLLKGDPAALIPEFAKSVGADLIVMGTVARAGIMGLLIGNTAETVLQRVDCSVLAVKPDGFISPVTLGA